MSKAVYTVRGQSVSKTTYLDLHSQSIKPCFFIPSSISNVPICIFAHTSKY